MERSWEGIDRGVPVYGMGCTMVAPGMPAAFARSVIRASAWVGVALMCVAWSVSAAEGTRSGGQAQERLSSWRQVVQRMEVHLRAAYTFFESGDSDRAYEQIDKAYFRYYEAKGMEKITMGYLSGARKAAVENAFFAYRRSVRGARDLAGVAFCRDKLVTMLYEDARALDGVARGRAGFAAHIATFVASCVLVLREGIEAILVIAAIVAYLVKTGKERCCAAVYEGAGAGVLFSVVLAVMIVRVLGSEGGAAQEIIEGVGMFFAAAMLFYVSNWMLSKARACAWDRYIRQKVERSVSRGNQWALVATAFLAVAREGAELILFFRGIPVAGPYGRLAVWAAVTVSALVLVGVFVAIRFLSVRLPLRPFFVATGAVMYLLCFSFVGKGVSELQEAGVVSRSTAPWMHGWSFDFLGIYPTYEGLAPQAFVVALVVLSAVWWCGGLCRGASST